MIALDAREQMDAQPFELISAHAAQCRRPGRIEIIADGRFIQRAHGHARHRHVLEQHLTVARHRNGGMQLMGLPRQSAQMFGSAGAIGRLTEAARAKRIHITPVAASGVADEAEYAMRAMAAATQSRYLFLTDDSGVGNPHAPPAIDCYLVTRLDALVRRVIDSQISGRRIEPDKDEVIRSVGQYDGGKCVLPADFKWDSN